MRKKGGDLVHGGEDHAPPLLQFEVDRHPSKMTERELDIIREFYYVPDYVELHLPEPSYQPTRPLLGCITVYRDYFIRGL